MSKRSEKRVRDDDADEKVERKMGRGVGVCWKTVGVCGIVVVAVALAGALVWQVRENRRLADPDFAREQAAAEARELRDRVERLMILPDEDPTIATVQDASRLAGQEFFRNAEDGDRVLIFTEARLAVIFRQGENRIVNSGPIVINSTGDE